jgi:acyl-coenzyme A thioesterase PaaI-like protein
MDVTAPREDTPDAAAIAAAMLAAVPFARTLGISFPEVALDGVGGIRVVAELPDDPSVHNHVGGPHAGAIFALGETASGAAVMAAFGDQLDRAVPLAVRAEIAYRKLAMGAVSAAARLTRDRAEVVAELDGGGRPEFGVEVAISRADGAVTAEMLVVWTLRPH